MSSPNRTDSATLAIKTGGALLIILGDNIPQWVMVGMVKLSWSCSQPTPAFCDGLDTRKGHLSSRDKALTADVLGKKINCLILHPTWRRRSGFFLDDRSLPR